MTGRYPVGLAESELAWHHIPHPDAPLEDAMMRTVTPATLLALGLSLAAAPLAPAHAQFGKLKKKAAAVALETAGLPTKPPTYVKSVGLTVAQFKQLAAGLTAEIAKAPSAQKEYEQQMKQLEHQTQDYEKARSDYDKKMIAYNACVDRVSAAESAKRDSVQARLTKSMEAVPQNQSQQDQLLALAEKAKQAAQRISEGKGTAEDRQTLAEYQKAMAPIQAGGQQAAAAMQEMSTADSVAAAHVKQACGQEPQEPAPPPSAPSGAADIIQAAGAAAAGVSQGDYRMWREEGIAYAESNTIVQSSDKTSNDEAEALNNGIKEIATLVAEMKKKGVPL